jgi:hypothetical protein
VSGTRRVASWLLGAALASGLLLGNVASRARTYSLDSDDQGWRGWDDLAVASGYAERGDFPVSPYLLGNRFRRRSDDFAAFRQMVLDGVAAAGLRPTHFWQPLPRGVFAPVKQWRIARRFDDVGRSVLLALGFRAVGGVAPFLILWLAPLALVPVFFWTAFEFSAAGRFTGGMAFLVAVSSSAFVIDALTLGYSAIGFYLLSLMMLVPLGVYCALGSPTRRGLVWRVACLSLPLGICILSRSACLLTMPGYALAIAVAAWRLPPPGSPRRRAVLTSIAAGLLGTGLLLAAWPVLTAAMHGVADATIQRYGQRRPLRQGHDVWSTVWEGLGDFDRTHGFVFADRVAEDTVLAAGGREWLSPEAEQVMKRLVLKAIASDPLWYLGILAKRTAATVTLHKLWPWPPLSGRSLTPAASENEGVIDNYYGLISPADVVRLGSITVELPMVLWLVPAAMLVALALSPDRGRWRRLRAESRPALVPLACLVVGALPIPVLITVATAFEAEAFIITHHLALGLLVSALLRARAQGGREERR